MQISTSKKIGLFFCGTFIVVFLTYIILRYNQSAVPTSLAIQEGIQKDGFSLAVCYSYDSGDIDYNDLLINWWHNEADNKYYFFLPQRVFTSESC